MTRAATRIGDVCTGHGCWPPRANIQGSSNVFINGIGAHRNGDKWEVHCCGDSCHDSSTVKTSSSVFINGKGAARVGDLIGCGSAIAQGSSNVFFG